MRALFPGWKFSLQSSTYILWLNYHQLHVPCRYLYNLCQQRIWAIIPASSFVRVDISAQRLK